MGDYLRILNKRYLGISLGNRQNTNTAEIVDSYSPNGPKNWAGYLS